MAKSQRSPKKSVEAHVDHTKYGMGDYYGSGIKQKMGRVRESYISGGTLDAKKLGTPPKRLA